MRKTATLLVLMACAGDPDRSTPVTPTPDACTEAGSCRAAKDLADAECSLRYACDPAYQEDSATCFAAEWSRLCESGQAAAVCAIAPCQRDRNLESCLSAWAREYQTTCEDPAACIPEPDAECTP